MSSAENYPDDKKREMDYVQKTYLTGAIIVGSLLLIAGLAYSLLQVYYLGGIEDKLYISLALGQNLFALYYVYTGLKYILNFQVEMVQNEKGVKGPFREGVLKLKYLFIDYKKFWWLSLSLGIGMCSYRLWQGYSNPDESITYAYLAFLFTGNLITGYFMYLFIIFIFSIKNLWGKIDIELWKRDTNFARFNFNLSKKLAFIGAVYMSMNITSVLTSSKIETDYITYLFFVFQILLLIGSIILPTLPYIKKVSQKKQEDYAEIENQIQREYNSIIEKVRNQEADINFDKMNSFLDVKNQLDSIHSFPFKTKTIFASFSIIFISLLPILFEYLVKLFME